MSKPRGRNRTQELVVCLCCCFLRESKVVLFLHFILLFAVDRPWTQTSVRAFEKDLYPRRPTWSNAKAVRGEIKLVPEGGLKHREPALWGQCLPRRHGRARASRKSLRVAVWAGDNVSQEASPDHEVERLHSPLASSRWLQDSSPSTPTHDQVFVFQRYYCLVFVMILRYFVGV